MTPRFEEVSAQMIATVKKEAEKLEISVTDYLLLLVLTQMVAGTPQKE